jgi:hypothetical protein
MAVSNLRFSLLTSVLIFSISASSAQQSLNASGGDGSGSGGTVAYSIGQVFFTSQSNGSGTIHQGVQQPHEILIVGEHPLPKSFTLTAFPNPSQGLLNLSFSGSLSDNLIYMIRNVQGQIIKEARVSGTVTPIDLSAFAPGTYFLNVYGSNRGPELNSESIKLLIR